MPESALHPPDAKPPRVTFADLGRVGAGVAFAGPVAMVPNGGVESLRAAAEEIRSRRGFSREAPPRSRSLHHLVPSAMDELDRIRLVDTASEWAGEPLAIHPSAHFGCSFNWTKLRPQGYADEWHLDAAPYTAVVLLSEPGEQYAGGELCLFTGEPEDLWRRLRHGGAPRDEEVRAVSFRHAGEVFLFQGRAFPHAVLPIRSGSGKDLVGVREGRLTLAVGLYAVKASRRWLYPGNDPDDRTVADCWRVEEKKARLLVAVERMRQDAAWLGDLDSELRHEAAIDAALARLSEP